MYKVCLIRRAERRARKPSTQTRSLSFALLSTACLTDCTACTARWRRTLACNTVAAAFSRERRASSLASIRPRATDRACIPRALDWSFDAAPSCTGLKVAFLRCCRSWRRTRNPQASATTSAAKLAVSAITGGDDVKKFQGGGAAGGVTGVGELGGSDDGGVGKGVGGGGRMETMIVVNLGASRTSTVTPKSTAIEAGVKAVRVCITSVSPALPPGGEISDVTTRLPASMRRTMLDGCTPRSNASFVLKLSALKPSTVPAMRQVKERTRR